MSSAYITFIPEDDKVKVNGVSTSRSLTFQGAGETVTDDPSNNTIDIIIPGLVKGVKTNSGDGINKVFTISHGMSTTPTVALIQEKSNDALGSKTVTVDSTNITITFVFPPPSGSGNIILSWIVA